MYKGFSVAEAMIALLIGSVALGMAAPMITKQVKQNNFADTQLRVVNQQNNNLREEIEELKERIVELENAEISIPKGSIVFFDSATINASANNNGCPNGFTNVSSNKAGRYIMLDSNANAGKINKAEFPNHRHLLGYMFAHGNDPHLISATNKFSSGKSKSDDIFHVIAHGEERTTRNTNGKNAAGFNFTQMFITAQEVLNDEMDISNELDVKPAALSVIACRKN